MLSNKLKLVTDPNTEDVLLLQNLIERRAGSPHVIAFWSFTYFIPLDLDFFSVSHCFNDIHLYSMMLASASNHFRPLIIGM